jgi:anti-sigma regulatory factor (Ser/Thr protein kinase)
MPWKRRLTLPYPRLLASHTLPPEKSSAAVARATVRSALSDKFGNQLLETVELLTSELVTNVIVHAATPCRLRLTEPRSGLLRVEVHDDTDSVAAVSVTSALPSSVHGRGLLLVDALADTWGTSRHSTGKTVWFDVST